MTFLSSIIDVCSEFVKYDPNYHYDETDDINLEPSGNEMETDGRKINATLIIYGK